MGINLYYMVDWRLPISFEEGVALLLFVITVFCYTIITLWGQDKLQWGDKVDWQNFWGKWSYKRKYTLPEAPPLNNWYYKLFEIPHKERFPGSATIFVWLTDGYHLAQAVMITAISAIPWMLSGTFWAFVITRIIWSLVFNVTYKYNS